MIELRLRHLEDADPVVARQLHLMLLVARSVAQGEARIRTERVNPVRRRNLAKHHVRRHVLHVVGDAGPDKLVGERR